MTSTIQFPATIIGLMSGTSADGVDAAILRTDGREVVEAGESLFVPYDDALRADILGLMRGVGDEADITRRLTDVHIFAVQELLKKAKIKADLVGFHGQTIRHAPAEGITAQIGDAARMAAELGIPVVADFRSNDVKHGGQGAPLVPLYHAALAATLEKPVMVVNIGGVSNVTWISGIRDQGSGIRENFSDSRSPIPDPWLIAFDSGPGNALLDDWVFQHTGKRCDENGEIAARGVAHSDIVSAFLSDPFFLADAPKSLDRLHFEKRVEELMVHEGHNNHCVPRARKNISLEDGAATLTSMTATSIALSFGAVPAAPCQVLISGGGRKNLFLMGLLKACVNAPVVAVEEVGWDGDMLEAQAFAYLAARSVQGLPLSLPTTTGVKEPVSGGKLFQPRCEQAAE